MEEKNCFDMTKLIFQIMCVVQRSSMLLEHADKPGSSPGDTVFCFFVPFYLLFGLFLLTKFFLLAFFFCSLTADPAGHALGLIYILSLSLEFYFGKKNTSAFVHRLNQQYYYPKISTGSVSPQK